MRSVCWLLIGLIGLIFNVSAEVPEPLGKPMPGGVDLGDGRYRIGSIEVDKPAGTLTVKGKILELQIENAPIEFLVVARDSVKSYEALVELDTDAFEFNLACILLGLDSTRSTRPKGHFDPNPITGDVVDLTISWEEDGETKTIPIENLLAGAVGEDEHVWVYTGSFFDQSGAFAAAVVGTLIGAVHDPWSIIHHQKGLALGDYGGITGNVDVMPPANTEVVVKLVRETPVESS